MTRLRFVVLFVSCLVILLRTPAQRPVAVGGNVYYADDVRPAKNVLVNLSNSAQVQLETQTTSDAGDFRFGGLKQGAYTVSINASGYEPIKLNVDISVASDKCLALYLKPISKKRDSPKAGSISAHELSTPTKARELMESGKKKLYQDKDPDGGLADFQKAISVAPDYYEAHYQVAMAYLTLGNRGEAEKSLRKSVEVSGDSYAEADVGLGAIIVDRGSFSEGEKTIRRGIQLNPNLWLGHYELGRALLNEKRIFEAQESAVQARLLAPRVPVVYRLLSNIHLEEKDYAALLQDIDAYLKLDPDSPAGTRAKQLREQVQRKVDSKQPASVTVKP